MPKKKKKNAPLANLPVSGSQKPIIDISQGEDLDLGFCLFLDACRHGRVEEARDYVTAHYDEMLENTRLVHLALYVAFSLPSLLPQQQTDQALTRENVPVVYNPNHFSIVDFLFETFPSLDLNQQFCCSSLQRDLHQFYIMSAVYYASSDMVKRLIQKGVLLDVKLSDQSGLLDMLILRVNHGDLIEREEAGKILSFLLSENEKKRFFSKQDLNNAFSLAMRHGLFHLTCVFLRHEVGAVGMKDLENISRILIDHARELFDLKRAIKHSYGAILNKSKKELTALTELIFRQHFKNRPEINVVAELPDIIKLLSNIHKEMTDSQESEPSERHEQFDCNEIYLSLLKYYLNLLERHYDRCVDDEIDRMCLGDDVSAHKKVGSSKGTKGKKKLTSVTPQANEGSTKKASSSCARHRSNSLTGDQLSLSSSPDMGASSSDSGSLPSVKEKGEVEASEQEAEKIQGKITALLEDETVKFIFDVIKELDGQTYLTGGAVRDLFSAQVSRDFDYITNLPAEVLCEVLKKKRCSARRSRVMLNLVTVEHEGKHIDIVCDRPLDLEKDARTKDFRCNALYLNQTGHVVEVLPGSIEDAKKLILTPTTSWENIFSVPFQHSQAYNKFWYLDNNPYRIMRTLDFVMREFNVADIENFRACARRIFLSQEEKNAEFQIQRVLENCLERGVRDQFLDYLAVYEFLDESSLAGLKSREVVNAAEILLAIQSSFSYEPATIMYPEACAYPGQRFFPIAALGHPWLMPGYAPYN